MVGSPIFSPQNMLTLALLRKKQNPLNLLHWILFYHYITKLLPKENISHNPSFYLVS
jgi:hypothetical protein